MYKIYQMYKSNVIIQTFINNGVISNSDRVDEKLCRTAKGGSRNYLKVIEL